MKETRLTPSDPAFVQVDRLHPPRDQQHVVEIDQQAELEPVFRCDFSGIAVEEIDLGRGDLAGNHAVASAP